MKGNELLIVKHLQLRDKDDLWLYVSDPEVTEYLTWSTYTDMLLLDSYLSGVVKKTNYPDEVLGIYRASRLIGTIHVISRGNNNVQFGFGLIRSEWNHGYCTRACEIALNMINSSWLPKENRLEFWADVNIRNSAAICILSKLGFVCTDELIEPMRARYSLIFSRY